MDQEKREESSYEGDYMPLEIEVEDSEETKTEEEIEQKKRNDYRFELALFFIFGLLLGITLKSEAVKRVTIGFDDYKIAKVRQGFDFQELKLSVVRSAEQQAQPEDAPTDEDQK